MQHNVTRSHTPASTTPPPFKADADGLTHSPSPSLQPIVTEKPPAEAATHNVRSLLSETAERYGDDLFLRMRKEGNLQTLTFRQLQERASALKAGLRNLGIRPGSRVALMSENSIEWAVAFFAVTCLGAVAVPMDPKLTATELSNLLSDCGPSTLFCSTSVLAKAEQAAVSLDFSKKIFTLDEGEKGWTRLMKDPAETVEAMLRPDDDAVILYTSGTTGNPKGVTLTHGNLAAAARTLADFVPSRRDDRTLFLLPLFHIYSLSTFLVSLAAGSRVTFENRLKGPTLMEALQEDRCTMMVAVPRLYESLSRTMEERAAQANPLNRFLFGSLRRCSPFVSAVFGRGTVRGLFSSVHQPFGGRLTALISGGGKLDPKIARFLESVGFVVQEGYGLTETTGAIAVNRFNRGKIGTVGEVIPLAEIRVDDPGQDGVGEILLKGPTVFKGYYGRNDLTAEAFRDGWFKTGDLGFVDRNGYLTLTGRKKDVIVLPSGKNVYPDEVEAAYGSSPLIRQIGVIGVDRGRGEEVFAFLVPQDDRGDRTAVEARIKEELARISETLSPHKRITQYRVVYEDLPQTQLGKAKRQDLRRLIETPTVRQASGPGPSEDALTEHVIAIIRRCISGHVPETIRSDSHLELDLGMDSLSRTELVTAMEKVFKISVPDQEILGVQTVKDIVQVLRRHTVGDIPPAAETSLTQEFSAHPAVPDRLDFSARGQATRLNWLREKTGAELKHIAHTSVDPAQLKGNIEHFIGMAQVPVGLAGPVLIDGDSAQGAFYVPLATTEGALVASVTRGMMAITYSGGARAKVLDDQVMRAPTWIFERGRQTEIFIDWMKANFDRIKAVAESTTRSGKLKSLEYIPNGRRVTVRFLYTSGDASGQNMVTMATHAACVFINKEQPVRGLVQHFLENNLSGDKKMSMVNILSTRGKKVYADAVIKKDVLRHFLHTSPEELAEFSKEGALGSMQAGIYGTNAQYANVIAAIFVATGQDVACTHEASTGLTVVDLTPEGDLYISVTLPNLIVATVGGGTGKGTQRECLEMMGCAGSGRVNRFAEIIAASVLAGEISISGAHAAGDFAQAHDKLGRNRPGERRS